MTPLRPDLVELPSSGRDDGRPRVEGGPGCVAARERVHAIYSEHSTALLNYVTRMTGCRDLAREVTQETFVRLLRMPPAMVGGIELPDAYLRRVATNLVRDRARTGALSERSRRLLEISSEGLLDQVAVLESRDTLRRLELAIGTLKPKTREIFLAHRIRGLSYAEIATMTGLSVKGVEKQMSKAIAKIDRLMDRV